MSKRTISLVVLVTMALCSLLNVLCNALPREMRNEMQQESNEMRNEIQQKSNEMRNEIQREIHRESIELSDKEKPRKVKGFLLIVYLPHTDDNTYCRSIREAINKNIHIHAIETIHLFRNNKSCVHFNDILISPKIVLHEVDRNMTFTELMKFIVHECPEENILLAKANMRFQSNLDIYVNEEIEDGVVHVLQGIHPYSHGSNYAFLFKGQWDSTITSFSTVGMEFELDSPRLDNENVMKMIFEDVLNMNLKASHIRAYPICLH